MLERPSEYRSGLPCPLCGRSLLPVTSETSFTFHCKTGHELSLEDLLTAQSLALRMGLETLLLEWNRQHSALIDTMEEARVNGHLDVAEIFQRNARNLEWRIDHLCRGFLRTESRRELSAPELQSRPEDSTVAG